MKLLFIFIAVVLGLLVLHWYLRKPLKLKIAQTDLERYLRMLLRRGYNGGFLVIQVPNSPLFLQFAKYVTQEGRAGLQFDFPLADWSRSHWQPLIHAVTTHGFPFMFQKGSDGTEFLVINLNQEIDRAAWLARLVLRTIYGLMDDQSVALFFQNVSPHDEQIGR